MNDENQIVVSGENISIDAFINILKSNQFVFSEHKTMTSTRKQSRYENMLSVSLQDFYKQKPFEYVEAIIGEAYYDHESEAYIGAGTT